MASSTSTKTFCTTCGNKNVGIFKCQGCSHTFCRKHVNEHRDMLSQQLDEIVLEYDTLQHTIIEQNDPKKFQQSLLKQVDEWEKKSIEKVRRTANKIRKQIEKLNIPQTGNVSKRSHDLAERLQKARQDDDFVETDLQHRSKTLKTLQNEVVATIFPVAIQEDSMKLIGKLNFSSTEQRLEVREFFTSSFGEISIRNDGSCAVHTHSTDADVFVRGNCEYSSGKYQIQFMMKTNQLGYERFFGIISKSKPTPQVQDDLDNIVYGWYTNDLIVSPGLKHSSSQHISDLENKKFFQIELILDCDNKMISYINQQTNLTRQIKINIKKCPFPWQILFYLFCVNDSVELMTCARLK